MPTIQEIERAICCPGGRCISPTECYAKDRTTANPVNVPEAARAVANLYREQWATDTTARDAREAWR